MELKLPVADGEIGGVIVNAAGQPAANAELRLFDQDREGRTDAQGRFKIGGLMHGWATLTIYPNGSSTEAGREDARIKAGQLDERIVLSGAGGLTPIPLEEPNLQGTLAKPVRPVKWYNSAPYQPEKPPGVIRILDFWGVACGALPGQLPQGGPVLEGRGPRWKGGIDRDHGRYQSLGSGGADRGKEIHVPGRHHGQGGPVRSGLRHPRDSAICGDRCGEPDRLPGPRMVTGGTEGAGIAGQMMWIGGKRSVVSASG